LPSSDDYGFISDGGLFDINNYDKSSQEYIRLQQHAEMAEKALKQMEQALKEREREHNKEIMRPPCTLCGNSDGDRLKVRYSKSSWACNNKRLCNAERNALPRCFYCGCVFHEHSGPCPKSPQVTREFGQRVLGDHEESELEPELPKENFLYEDLFEALKYGKLELPSLKLELPKYEDQKYQDHWNPPKFPELQSYRSYKEQEKLYQQDGIHRFRYGK
jgi:hypothetical protein